MDKAKNITAIMKTAGKKSNGTEPHFDIRRLLYWDADLQKHVFCNREGDVWFDKYGVEIEDDVDYENIRKAVEFVNEMIKDYRCPHESDNQIIFKFPEAS